MPASQPPRHTDAEADARALLRQAFKATLATLEPATGAPYASLVTLATAADGAPILLLSTLALHTRNLAADPRASLLIDATSATGDPLAGGRISLSGRIATSSDPGHRARFLARHPPAAHYADFADFSFHRFELERSHYIGGFGRIVDIAPQQLLTDVSGTDALLAAEADIVAHMNTDHSDTQPLYAAAELRRRSQQDRGRDALQQSWRMIAIDPDGFDLAADGEGLRITFRHRITTADQARAELVRLAAAARAPSA